MAQQLGVRGQRLGSSGHRRARSGLPVSSPVAPRVSSSVSSSVSGSGGGWSARHVVCRAKLDEVSLFADSSLLSGPSGTATAATSAGGVETVELKSKLGLDYAPLSQYLKDQDFRKADDETRALLIKMAGPGAVARGWVYFSEVKTIPAEDLQTVDALWRAASKGKFGYSVQRELFQQSARRWPKFFRQIDWTVGEHSVYRKWPAEFVYSMDAVKGHLPLTNALRGTQLFEALLGHPAFDKQAGGKAGPGIDDRSKAAGANTLKF